MINNFSFPNLRNVHPECVVYCLPQTCFLIQLQVRESQNLANQRLTPRVGRKRKKPIGKKIHKKIKENKKKKQTNKRNKRTITTNKRKKTKKIELI